LLLIRDLLINQLKDTDAVLFDVRSNGGGSITLAESISQLFRTEVESTSARALVTNINQKLFADVSNRKDWGAAYMQTGPGDVYTPPVKFTSNQEVNKLGNAYGIIFPFN
jgi:hypothetical protein